MTWGLGQDKTRQTGGMGNTESGMWLGGSSLQLAGCYAVDSGPCPVLGQKGGWSGVQGGLESSQPWRREAELGEE